MLLSTKIYAETSFSRGSKKKKKGVFLQDYSRLFQESSILKIKTG